MKGSLSKRLTGPLKLPVMDTRAMENPISAIFDLAEQVSDKAAYIRKNFWWSMLFVVFWLGATVFFFFLTMVRRNVIGSLILLIVLISGFYTFRMLYFDYLFFDFFAKRFHAIKVVREGNPNLYIPSGNSAVERFLNHLAENHPIFKSILKKYPDSIQFYATLLGKSGKKYQCDVYIGIPGGSNILKKIELPSVIKREGYAFFVKFYDHTPTLKDITGLEEMVKDITAKTCLPPRVVALSEGGSGEIPEDLYNYVTASDERRVVKCGRKVFPLTIQVVTGAEGVYDYVPLISPEGLP